MPDLNELLRWSIANTPAHQETSEPDAQPTEPLTLRFHPAADSGAGTSALHPSDPQYRASHQIEDASPASTPGPVTPDAEVRPRQELNSEILDIIMGKSDSTMMKEKMEYAIDEKMPVEKRIEALDDFEMMIELIDNANNMTVLKMWEPLLSLLDSPEDGIVAHACWIIGTAVQNNLKAQAAMFIHNALPPLLNIIQAPSSSRQHPTSTRARATYALSSSVKHWPLAAHALSSSSDAGYTVLAASASDSAPIIRRKTAFLVHTLVLQSGEKYEGEIPKEVQALLEERMKQTAAGASSELLLDGLKRTGVFTSLVEGLKARAGDEDVEFEENAIRALSQAAAKGGLSTEEKDTVKSIWEKWGSVGQEERGLDGEDGKEIQRLLA